VAQEVELTRGLPEQRLVRTRRTGACGSLALFFQQYRAGDGPGGDRLSLKRFQQALIVLRGSLQAMAGPATAAYLMLKAGPAHRPVYILSLWLQAW
jgi:hypothetical protein